MNFPGTLDTKVLDAPHPERVLYSQTWADLQLLYDNGTKLKNSADRFLNQRPKEHAEQFAERIKRFSAQKVLGSALTWYLQALFNKDPDVYLKTQAGADVPKQDDDWYSQWRNDCDESGTTFVDFMRDAVLWGLLLGRCYVLIETPGTEYEPGEEPASLAEQKANGDLDPYLVLFKPDAAVNWQKDKHGNLEWITFKSTDVIQVFGQAKPKIVDRWYYYDQTECAVYEAERRSEYGTEEPKANLVPGYPKPHALSGIDEPRIPVHVFEMPEGLWLGDAVYMDLVMHINLRNALFMGLLQACFPWLVISGGVLEAPVRNEATYLRLPDAATAEYLETSGTSFEIMQNEIGGLRQEMYRSMHLQAQGRDSSATAGAQSGYSKELDMAPANDILSGLGDLTRAAMLKILADVIAVRGDDVVADVNGFDFDDTDAPRELSEIQQGLDLKIPSKTHERELLKRAVRITLRGRKPDIIAQAEDEIEKNPTPSEMEAAAQQQAQQKVAGAMQMAISRYSQKAAAL